MKVKKNGPGNSTATPSPQVLSLISLFLTEHGFDSTSKTFRKELKRMQQSPDLNGVPANVNLQLIVDSWNSKVADDSSESETSTSGSESELESQSDTSTSSTSSNSELSDDESNSSDEGSGSSEEEVKTKQAPKAKKSRVGKRAASTPESSASSSDSDADDEDEAEDEGAKITKIVARKTSPNTIKVAEALVKKNLKRKAESSSSEESSDSTSSDSDRPAKRTKVGKTATVDDASSSEASSTGSEQESSDTETSSAEEEEEEEEEADDNVEDSSNRMKAMAVTEARSDSSGTVMGDVVTTTERSSDLEDLPDEEPKSVVKLSKSRPTTKKHAGAKPTPLAQLSGQATADSHISNAYRSYDYADRAYNDLSVTRGKGFTKEKNKKKRGSYRGGAIDISGGKAFKFDD